MNALIHLGLPNSGSTYLQKVVFPSGKNTCYVDPFEQKNRNNFYFPLLHLEDFFFRQSDPFGYLEEANREHGHVTISHESFSASQCLGRDAIAERRHKLFPKARILIILRSQSTAVVSYYAQLLQNPYSPIQPFNDWFDKNIRIHKRSAFRHYHYDALVDYYVEKFGRERVGLFLYEDMNRDPEGFIEALSRFSGVDFKFQETDRVNARTGQRNLRARQVVETFISGERLARAWLAIPGSVRKPIKRFFKSGKPLDIQLSREQEAELARAFGSGNRALEAEFNLPLEKVGYPAEIGGG